MAFVSGGLAVGFVLPSIGATPVQAATPSATPGAAGDTRSAGEGPGLVGSPVLAIVGVLALGGVTALLTLAYVRLTRRHDGREGPGAG